MDTLQEVESRLSVDMLTQLKQSTNTPKLHLQMQAA